MIRRAIEGTLRLLHSIIALSWVFSGSDNEEEEEKEAIEEIEEIEEENISDVSDDPWDCVGKEDNLDGLKETVEEDEEKFAELRRKKRKDLTDIDYKYLYEARKRRKLALWWC